MSEQQEGVTMMGESGVRMDGLMWGYLRAGGNSGDLGLQLLGGGVL